MLAMVAGSVARRAEYCLFELALPGRKAFPAGVILLDTAGKRSGFRLREDIESFGGDLHEEDREVLAGLGGQIAAELRDEGGEAWLRRAEDSFSNAVRIGERRSVEIRSFEWQLDRLFDEQVMGVVREPCRILPFVRHLPVYSLRAAAGRFLESGEIEPEGWAEAPEGMRLTRDMFVAHVAGHSMEPKIPDGSLAVFRGAPGGSRQGLTLLVWRCGSGEGDEFTLKEYRSVKRALGEGSWEHSAITLAARNEQYEDLELEGGADYRVLGEFVCVLVGKDGKEFTAEALRSPR